MKISNKLKAVGVVTGIFASAVAGSMVFKFIAEMFDQETLQNAMLMIFSGASFALMFYCLYFLVLARFDYQDTLQKLNKSITDKNT